MSDVIGKIVTVTVDRKAGSCHPVYKDICYPVNYGFIEGIIAPDGEWQDAYILGINEPISIFTGKVIAIIQRRDDIEKKWVVASEKETFTIEEIGVKVNFQEQYFDSKLVLA